MSTLLVFVAVCALVVAAVAVTATVAVLLGLVREVVGALMEGVGRLLVIGACLMCLLVVLVHSFSPASTGLH